MRPHTCRIRQRPRPGVEALCRSAGIDPVIVTADHVAFKLAPRLNAAGRMSDPALALRLLLTDEHRASIQLAEEIEALNQLRRAESQRIVAEAEQLILARPDWIDRRLLLIACHGWTGGVLGIAASQLAERHGRPARRGRDARVSSPPRPSPLFVGVRRSRRRPSVIP